MNKIALFIQLFMLSFPVIAEVKLLSGNEKISFQNQVKEIIPDYRDNFYQIDFLPLSNDIFLYTIHDAAIYSGSFIASIKQGKTVKLAGGFPTIIGTRFSLGRVQIVTKGSGLRKGIASEIVSLSSCNLNPLECAGKNIFSAEFDAETGNCGRGLSVATEITAVYVEESNIEIETQTFDCITKKSTKQVRAIAM